MGGHYSKVPHYFLSLALLSFIHIPSIPRVICHTSQLASNHHPSFIDRKRKRSARRSSVKALSLATHSFGKLFPLQFTAALPAQNYSSILPLLAALFFTELHEHTGAEWNSLDSFSCIPKLQIKDTKLHFRLQWSIVS